MNNAERAMLDATPVPIDVDGRPVRCMAVKSNGEWRTAWGFDGMRRPTPFGPVYERARDAASASRRINGEDV